MLAFCDLGVGIPATMGHTKKYSLEAITEFIFRLRLLVTDGSLILAAFQLGISQTKEAHRGKGLVQLMQVIGDKANGMLVVLSGCGMYRYAPSRHEKVISRNYSDKVPGTMIFWEIPIDGADDGKGD